MIDLARLFHDKDPKEIVEDCTTGPYAWDLSGRFPRPLFQPHCPQCGSDDVQLSRMQFSSQPEKGCRWTADVYFKCRACSYGPKGFHFGVKIPERMYEEAHRDGRFWEWREIRDYWQGEGVIEDA